MPLDPSILSFAVRLARIKSRQMARVLPNADVLDLQQDLLLEVIGGWGRFDARRGRAEAFVEHLVAQRCWKIRRRRYYLASCRQDSRCELEQIPVRGCDSACDSEKQEAVRRAVARMPTHYRDACQALCDTDTVSSAARRLAIPRSTLESIIAKLRHSLAAITAA